MSRAPRGEEANRVSRGAVIKHGSFGGAETRWVERHGVFATAPVEIVNRLSVPGAVSEDFERFVVRLGRRLPVVHFLFDVFLNEVTIAAVPRHQVENDDTALVVVEVEPARFIDVAGLDIAAIQRFVDEVRDGGRLCVRLEQLVHAVEHRQCSEGNRTEHHHSDDEGLPRVLLLEHTPIGLVKQAHTSYWSRVVEECSPTKRWWARPELNRRSSPCEGDVITPRPRAPR